MKRHTITITAVVDVDVPNELVDNEDARTDLVHDAFSQSFGKGKHTGYVSTMDRGVETIAVAAAYRVDDGYGGYQVTVTADEPSTSDGIEHMIMEPTMSYDEAERHGNDEFHLSCRDAHPDI